MLVISSAFVLGLCAEFGDDWPQYVNIPLAMAIFIGLVEALDPY